jgi:hypothetical protein
MISSSIGAMRFSFGEREIMPVSSLESFTREEMRKESLSDCADIRSV